MQSYMSHDQGETTCPQLYINENKKFTDQSKLGFDTEKSILVFSRRDDLLTILPCH